MKVSEVMTRHVLTVSPDTPLRRVQSLMLRYHLNDLLVVEDGDKLVGIITYKDLFRAFFPTYKEVMENEIYWTNPEAIEGRLRDVLNIPAKKIMTTELFIVSPGSHAILAGGLMNARQVKQLPVVDNGRLVGIISRRDIIWCLMMKSC